jgi:hypothetical protein
MRRYLVFPDRQKDVWLSIDFRVSFLLWVAIAISPSLLQGADLATYRNFHLGMTLTDVARQANVAISNAQLISSRPARVEELDWHANWAPHSEAQSNPFSELVFRFYNGELFELEVTYDRDQTRGLTEADMIEAISGAYGPAAQSLNAEALFGAAPVRSSLKVIARWENPTTHLDFVRLPYGPGFAILISSRANKTLAENAIVESERLDRVEAPQRELALRTRQLSEAQAADDKARATNKPGFRP